MDCTLVILLYGEYPDIARRCLASLVPTVKQFGLDVRLCTNMLGPQSRAFVGQVTQSGFARLHYDSNQNRRKYPLMRRAFFDPEQPITTPWVMWFDDDSYLREPEDIGWYTRVVAAFANADMLGRVYQLALQGQQHRAIQAQPWYGGKPVDIGARVSFATGGWWCLRTEIIRRYDWPIPSLDHCGGDVLLGELCRQQNLRLVNFDDGVAINADATGRHSSAPRRGFDSQPWGYDYSG